MPKSKHMKTEGDKPRISKPSLDDLLYPLGSKTENLSAKGHILRQLDLTNHHQPHSKEAILLTKGATVRDVEDFMLRELDNEIYAAGRDHISPDEEDEGPLELYNAARLKELTAKQQHDAIMQVHQQQKRERQQCAIATQEKQMFFQEVEQLKKRIKINTNQKAIIGQVILNTKDEYRNKLMVYKQKLKNLQSEQYSRAFAAKTERLDGLLPSLKETWEQEKHVYEGLMQYLQNDATNRLMLNNLLRNVKTDQVLQNQKYKEEFVAIEENLMDTFENFTEEKRKQVEDQIKEHMRLVDADKNHHISYMLEVQAKGLNNLRNYFQDIVSSNADKINDLKAQVDSKRAKLDHLERGVYRALDELNHYQGPMQHIEGEVGKMETVLASSKTVKERLAKKHINRRLLADDVKRYRWMKEISATRVEKCKDELNDLEKISLANKFAFMQKAALSNLIHSKTWNYLSEEVCMYEISFAILKDLCGETSSEIAWSKSAAKNVLQEQALQIATIRARVLQMKKHHKSLWTTVRRLFQEKRNSTIESMGFRPPDLDELFPLSLQEIPLTSEQPERESREANRRYFQDIDKWEKLKTPADSDTNQRLEKLGFEREPTPFQAMSQSWSTGREEGALGFH